jgi:hypothetical protein
MFFNVILCSSLTPHLISKRLGESPQELATRLWTQRPAVAEKGEVPVVRTNKKGQDKINVGTA